uniref:SP-RING-type domain-containing protein n=1 Tax=Panagrellus redivivus TaxID=6233 RepID=A0A7E4ZVF9_PANRE
MSSSEVSICLNIVATMKVNNLINVLQAFEHVAKPARKLDLQNRLKMMVQDPILGTSVCQRIREETRTGNVSLQGYNSYVTPRFRPPVANGYGGYVAPPPRVPSFNGYSNGFAPQNVSSSAVQLPSKVGGRAENMMITRLPFYDVSEPVLRLSELQCMPGRNGDVRASFSLVIPDKWLPHLSYRQDKPLPRYEVQLRMFQFDLDVEQADDFPPKCAVNVNDQPVNLPAVIPTNKPNAEVKRLSRPVDITHAITRNNAVIRQSKLDIEWYSDRRTWVVGVWVVNRLNTDLLHERLFSRGPRRSIEETKQKIAQMLSGDDDNIAVDQLKVSLICSLMRTRQTFPGRAKGCQHLQTFDLKNYLLMNEKRPSWKCPQCGTNAHFDNLVIDDYFMDLLQKVDKDVREVELLRDGSWKVSAVSDDDDSEDERNTPLEEKPKPTHLDEKPKSNNTAAADDSIIVLDSDEEAPNASKSAPSSSRPAKRPRRRSTSTSSASSSSSSGSETSSRRRKHPRKENPAGKPPPARRAPDVITLSDSSDEEPPRPAVTTGGQRSATASVDSNGTSSSSASSTALPNGGDAPPVRLNGARNGLNGARPGLNGLRNDVNANSRLNLPRDFLHNIFLAEAEGTPEFNSS